MHDNAWIVPDGPRTMIVFNRPAISSYEPYMSYYMIFHFETNQIQYVINSNNCNKNDFYLSLKRSFSLPLKLIPHNKSYSPKEMFWEWYLGQNTFLFDLEGGVVL